MEDRWILSAEHRCWCGKGCTTGNGCREYFPLIEHHRAETRSPLIAQKGGGGGTARARGRNEDFGEDSYPFHRVCEDAPEKVHFLRESMAPGGGGVRQPLFFSINKKHNSVDQAKAKTLAFY